MRVGNGFHMEGDLSFWRRVSCLLSLVTSQPKVPSGTRNFIDFTSDIKNTSSKGRVQGFPGGAVVKNPPANAGNTGSSPGPGRFHMPRSN